MADACGRCGGKGWYWNGQRRVTCRQPHGSGHAQIVRREDWPAVRAQLLERGRA